MLPTQAMVFDLYMGNRAVLPYYLFASLTFSLLTFLPPYFYTGLPHNLFTF